MEDNILLWISWMLQISAKIKTRISGLCPPTGRGRAFREPGNHDFFFRESGIQPQLFRESVIWKSFRPPRRVENHTVETGITKSFSVGPLIKYFPWAGNSTLLSHKGKYFGQKFQFFPPPGNKICQFLPCFFYASAIENLYNIFQMARSAEIFRFLQKFGQNGKFFNI